MVQVKGDVPNTSLIHRSNAIILAETTTKDLAQFHHATLRSPAKSTLIAAIDKGFLVSFPGLTRKFISKHLPKSEATVKRHLDQERKNLQTTRPNKQPITVSSLVLQPK